MSVSGELRYFGFVPGLECPAPEADHLASLVMDREHQAASETIIKSATLPLADQAALFELSGSIRSCCRRRLSLIPRIGRKPRPNSSALLSRDAPLGQVRPSFGPGWTHQVVRNTSEAISCIS